MNNKTQINIKYILDILFLLYFIVSFRLLHIVKQIFLNIYQNLAKLNFIEFLFQLH